MRRRSAASLQLFKRKQRFQPDHLFYCHINTERRLHKGNNSACVWAEFTQKPPAQNIYVCVLARDWSAAVCPCEPVTRDRHDCRGLRTRKQPEQERLQLDEKYSYLHKIMHVTITEIMADVLFRLVPVSPIRWQNSLIDPPPNFLYFQFGKLCILRRHIGKTNLMVWVLIKE